MNLVGKIFIVLILVASTVFMTMGMMVYATHKNWHDLVLGTMARDHHSGYQEQLKNAYAKQDELNHNIEKLQNILSLEKASHLQELAKAETAKAKAEEHKAELENAVKEEQVRLDTDAKALEIAQKNLTDSRSANVALAADNRDAHKKTDEQLKIATETEDKLHIALGQLADLKQRNEQLANQYAMARVTLRKLRPDMQFNDQAEPPMVRGEILAIDKEDRVEISLGSDDGIRDGNNLLIYRGDKYLGRIQVLETQPHRAIGMVLKDYKQEMIRKGDQVATKLRT